MKNYLPPTEKKTIVERWEELLPLLPETLESDRWWRSLAGSPFQKLYGGLSYEVELHPQPLQLPHPELGLRFFADGLESVIGIAVSLQEPPKTRMTGLLYLTNQDTLIRYVLETDSVDAADLKVQQFVEERKEKGDPEF